MTHANRVRRVQDQIREFATRKQRVRIYSNRGALWMARHGIALLQLPSNVPAKQLVPLNQALERYASSLGGRKMLYAHAYHSRKDFWKLYDRATYEHLRDTYAATAVFPDLYEKTHGTRSYRPSIWRGLWRLLWSPTKLRIAPDAGA